jgi:hypothetical protein
LIFLVIFEAAPCYGSFFLFLEKRGKGRKMEWDPTQYFRTDTTPKLPYAILVLNQPINERAFDAIRRHGQ